MYRIGIIGTENSHAMAFSEIMNQDESLGARVVGVMGPGTTAEDVVKATGVDFIAQDASEFFGKVDAMMITCRHGSKHADYARPFIEAGMPLFIDKPITSNIEECLALLRLAKAKNVPLCGGSGVKYAPDAALLREKADALRAEGALISASICYSADTTSEYDGLHFYAPHLAEMALTILGNDLRALSAVAVANSVLVTARYDDLPASLHFNRQTPGWFATLHGRKEHVHQVIDTSMIYPAEVKQFLGMLNTGRMPQDYDAMIRPVQLVCAVIESMQDGRTIACDPIVV